MGRMKVTDEHRDQIKDAIERVFANVLDKDGLDEEAVRDKYRRREIPRGDAVQDIDMRFRWDLYWAGARLTGGLPDSQNGYNDKHIDTALRSIVAPL